MGLIDRFRDYFALRGNIPALFVSNIVEGTAWNMHELVWQPFILSLGGSTPIIGLFISIWTIVQAVLQLGTGELCDALGRKKLINAYYLLSVLGLILSLMAGSWVYLIPTVLIYAVADSLGEPAFHPIYAESVDPKKVGMAFSLLSLTWWIPGFYSQLLAGFLGDNVGVRRVLYISLALEVLALLIHYVFVRETLSETRPVRVSLIWGSIKDSLRPRGGLRGFYALSVLDRFGWALSGGIFIAMIYESFDFSLLQIGALLTVASVATSIALIPVGRLVDRYGCKWSLVSSAALSAVLFVGYMLTRDYLSFLLLQVVRGVAIALWDPASSTYLSNAVEESERGRFFGNLNGLKGILSFPAPIVGALLFDAYGFKGTFTASLIVSLGALALSFRVEE